MDPLMLVVVSVSITILAFVVCPPAREGEIQSNACRVPIMRDKLLANHDGFLLFRKYPSLFAPLLAPG